MANFIDSLVENIMELEIFVEISEVDTENILQETKNQNTNKKTRADTSSAEVQQSPFSWT